ncbi:hypothetical protein BKA93DRAFT_881496 [Sparassis latifolia]
MARRASSPRGLPAQRLWVKDRCAQGAILRKNALGRQFRRGMEWCALTSVLWGHRMTLGLDFFFCGALGAGSYAGMQGPISPMASPEDYTEFFCVQAPVGGRFECVDGHRVAVAHTTLIRNTSVVLCGPTGSRLDACWLLCWRDA